MKTTAVWSLLVLAAPCAAQELIEREVSRVKLRHSAFVIGDTILLADVLEFTAADPRLSAEVGDESIGAPTRPPNRLEITHRMVVGRLAELGVNLSRVLVDGALACQVRLETADRPDPATERAAAAPLLRTKATQSGDSLADALRAYIAEDCAALGGEVEVDFERAGREFLELTSPPWMFSIRPTAGKKLGMREFRVVIRKDGKKQRTAHIVAQVRLFKQVLTAKRALGIGTYVRRGDVALEPHLFERWQDLGLESPQEILGQRVKRFIAAGEMLRRGDIKAVDLVKRSRPVTVVGNEDNIYVRLTGTAVDSGGYGDTVRVRIGESRKQRRELRCVVTGVGTVRMIEGG